MIYRGPSFLAVVRFGSLPASSRQQIVSLSRYFCVSPPVILLTGKGEGGDGRGAKSYNRKKAWTFQKSFNPLYLSP
jgi:hypothetical protein